METTDGRECFVGTFLCWLEANRDAFSHPPLLRWTDKGTAGLVFEGVNPMVQLSLRDFEPEPDVRHVHRISQLTVRVGKTVGGWPVPERVFGILHSGAIVARLSAHAGIVDTAQPPAVRRVYESLEGLWTDRLFLPLLHWMEETLRADRYLCLFRTDSDPSMRVGIESWDRLNQLRERHEVSEVIPLASRGRKGA